MVDPTTLRSGFMDVRKEVISCESFRVRNRKVFSHLTQRHEGRITRIAGDSGFEIVLEADGAKPRDTPFSSFVREYLSRASAPPPPPELPGDAEVPPELRALSTSLARGETEIGFHYRTRHVRVERAYYPATERVEHVRLASIDHRATLARGDIHLRTFLHNPTPSSLEMSLTRIMSLKKQLRSAEHIEPTASRVILDPGLAAVLIHETVGHHSEWVRWSTFGGLGLGGTVGTEALTVVDEPRPGGPEGPTFDDEGVETIPVTLVEKGVVCNVLHTLESAFRSQAEPNGRARARDFRHAPIPRMSNLRLAAGTPRFEDLLAAVGDGFYLVGAFGAINAMNVCQIGCQYGFQIESGKIGEPKLISMLSGYIPKLLRSIELVSDDFRWVEEGGCLAEDQFLLPSGRGAPHLLLSNANVS